MEIEKAIQVADYMVFQHSRRHLRDIEVLILKGSLEGITYEQVAERGHYTVFYIRNISVTFWRLLSDVLGERVSKKNCASALERQMRVLDVDANSPNLPKQPSLNIASVEEPVSLYALVVTGFFTEEHRLQIEAVLEALQSNLLNSQVVIKQKSS